MEREAGASAVWRFFIEKHGVGTDSERPVSVLRLRAGDPLMCAEALTRKAWWRRTDALYRQIMLGSDYDYEEVAAESAQEVIAAWVAEGVIPGVPEDHSEDRPDEDTVASWAEMEAESVRRWAAVPNPPGAEEVT